MQIRSVGINLGKTTFHLVALGAAGKVLVRKKFTQKQLLAYTANMQTSLRRQRQWLSEARNIPTEISGKGACWNSGRLFLDCRLLQHFHDVQSVLVF
jgi:hypothetical protein